jgi:hypothetical protein
VPSACSNPPASSESSPPPRLAWKPKTSARISWALVLTARFGLDKPGLPPGPTHEYASSVLWSLAIFPRTFAATGSFVDAEDPVVGKLGHLLQGRVQGRGVEQDSSLPGGLFQGLGQIAHHLLEVLVEQRVVLHDEDAVVVSPGRTSNSVMLRSSRLRMRE